MPILKNQRHERFAQELAKGTPAVQAYIRAGYRKTHSHSPSGQLRKHPDVERRYHEIMEAAAKQTEVTAAAVITELARIAFANFADFVTVDKDGILQPDFSRMTREQAAAVAEFTVNEFEAGRGSEGRRRRHMRFKLLDKIAALAHLGKMLGLYRERVELSGANGGPVETKEAPSDFEVAKRIAFLLAKAEATVEGKTAATPTPEPSPQGGGEN